MKLSPRFFSLLLTISCFSALPLRAGCSFSSAAGAGGSRAPRISVNAQGSRNTVTISVIPAGVSERTADNIVAGRRASLTLADATKQREVLWRVIEPTAEQLFSLAKRLRSEDLKAMIKNLMASRGQHAPLADALVCPYGVSDHDFTEFKQLYGMVHRFFERLNSALSVEASALSEVIQLKMVIRAALTRAGATAAEIDACLSGIEYDIK